MDSCFALIGARQHCVAKICNASQRANAHKLQNDPFHINFRTLNSLACAQKHALPHHVFQGARRPKCHDWCLEKPKINVAGQSQPKHLTAWPVPCFKTQRIGSESCDPALSVLVMLVSRNVFHVSLAVYCLYTFAFEGGEGGLIRSLADPTLAALIVCGPLQLVTHLCIFGP